MKGQMKCPGAAGTAHGAGVVGFAGATNPHTAIAPLCARAFALTWLGARHHVRPEWAGIIAEAARLGGQS